MRFNTDMSGLVPQQPETASRKARTRHTHTPLAGIANYADVYQTAALQSFMAWLRIGAASGPVAFHAAIRKAGYLPYPPESQHEAHGMQHDTGILAIPADTDKLTQRERLRASTAVFSTVLERCLSQPSCDFVAVNVLRPMLAGDLRYVAATAGMQLPQDSKAGISPLSPRIATYATWLLTSMVYVCDQLHTTSLDRIGMQQATAYEAIEQAEQAHKARSRKLAKEHHKQANKWHDLVLKDSAIRKLERRTAAQAQGKPKGYRHH